MQKQLSFIPLGGIGDITKNMYVYEYDNQLFIVDCGLGFADETMLGVDLLLPDITYLLQTKKKIVGMALTHGHEDHIGALPFILPQLSSKPFPIFATPLTAAFANEKLKEFQIGQRVQSVPFGKNKKQVGPFTFSFIHVTHSVPDTSHIFLQTPVGNIYHGSDFKLDPTPADKNTTDFAGIEQAGNQGVLCLLSDCLGSERKGVTPTEITLSESFEREMRQAKGKFIVTTYSSHIARLNQILAVSEKLGRKVCFIGRSLIKAKEVAQRLGYMHIPKGFEVALEQLKHHKDSEVTFIIAGSQGQENSAMARIANGEHREVSLAPSDVVIFSADPIPGNEVIVYSLIDSLARKGVRVVYSNISHAFHVSGHGSQDELSKLMSLTKPKWMLPIGGAFRHMVSYQNLAVEKGYKKSQVLLLEDGQEILFANGNVKLGRKIPVKNVYVDEISGEELEHFVLRDRQRLSEGGVVILLVEVDSETGQLITKPEIIARGFQLEENKRLHQKLSQDITSSLNRKGKITNWVYFRKLIGEITERRIYKELHRRPLVLPVVIEA